VLREGSEEALEADRATLYLLDEANDELVSRIAHGADVRSIRLKIGHGIAGHVARTGKPSCEADAQAGSRGVRADHRSVEPDYRCDQPGHR